MIFPLKETHAQMVYICYLLAMVLGFVLSHYIF